MEQKLVSEDDSGSSMGTSVLPKGSDLSLNNLVLFGLWSGLNRTHFSQCRQNLIKGMGVILTLTWSGSKNVEGSMRAGLSDSLEGIGYNTMENSERITITPWPFELVLLAVTIRDALLYFSSLNLDTSWLKAIEKCLGKVKLVLRKGQCWSCFVWYCVYSI